MSLYHLRNIELSVFRRASTLHLNLKLGTTLSRCQMARFKSDRQRKAAFAQMNTSDWAKKHYTKEERIQYLRDKQKQDANNPTSDTRQVVKCPHCGSSDYKYLGLAPLNSRSYSAAIPQLVGFDYTSYQNVAYYVCNNCNTSFYCKPISVL
jgi:hypothetical protein